MDPQHGLLWVELGRRALQVVERPQDSRAEHLHDKPRRDDEPSSSQQRGDLELGDPRQQARFSEIKHGSAEQQAQLELPRRLPGPSSLDATEDRQQASTSLLQLSLQSRQRPPVLGGGHKRGTLCLGARLGQVR